MEMEQETIKTNESVEEDTVKEEIDTEAEAGPSHSNDECDKPAKFHVDRTLIPSSQLCEAQTAEELQLLGLDVFNQDEFEQGVMAQVDLALAKEEEEKKQKQLKKEEIDLKYEIALANKEIQTLEKVISSLSGAAGNNHVKNRLISINNKKQNKVSQLKTATARLRSVQAKLHGRPLPNQEEDTGDQHQENKDLNQLLGLGNVNETEKERLIRLGQMTPFGTVITDKPSSSPEKHNIQLSEKTVFDNSTEDSNEVDKVKKSTDSDQNNTNHKASGAGKSSTNEKSTYDDAPKKENFFDERDKKHYRDDVEGSYYKNTYRSRRKYSSLVTNFREDSAMSDEENCYYDDPEGYLSDEYKPDEAEFKSSSDDNDDDAIDEEETPASSSKVKKRKKALRPKKPPKFHLSDDGSDMESPTKQKKRDPSVRKCRDDGDEYHYSKRMSDFNEMEKIRMKKVDSGEISDEEDEELEGGLKVPGRIWSKLFNYQKVGVSWLWELHCQEAGGIIGDEMGLGKTIQMIAFLAAMRHSRLRLKNLKYTGMGPTLIVCPTTVMHQWVKEFHKWWPLFRVSILHSSGSYTCSEEELVRATMKERGILITSYNTLVVHQNHLLPYPWHYVVLDEGHKIRNPDAQATLCCKQLKTPHRIILSGSPIQNNLKELWSLFDFIFPGKLGTLPDFMQHFSVPIVQGGYSNATQTQVTTSYKCACVLRDTINPYLLRRMKADVKINLPSKNEQVLFCRLTDEQTDVYMEYLQSRECQAILSGKYQIFAGLITLRKICNHPDICTGGPKLFIGEGTNNDESLEYGYWKRSGKMIVVSALLKLWKKQGHRVLLFSQSRAMLDILEHFTQREKYSYLRLDGGTPISSRQTMIDTFNKDDSIYLFLLTTRVGGLGVNLTGANRVIIFDPDWNPSTDTQARERTWRIGQTRQVTIYRLLTTGTIEEKIYHRQIFKQFLTNRVLKDPKQRRFFKSNDLYELFDLGSRDNREGTETSAIFAGTGSEVKRSDVKLNRFDMLKEKQKAEAKAESENEDEKYFEEDEINRMRELAKKLSQRLMESKDKSSDISIKSSRSSEVKHVDKSDVQGSNSDITENKNQSETTSKHKSKSTHSPHKHNKEECSDKITEREKPSKHMKKHSSHKEKSLDKEKYSSSKNGSSRDHKKKKHKHKRKHKDAVFEGEKIPHLVKQDIYQKEGDAGADEEKKKAMDDYVLHKLFKKNGLQCAMKHDVIMDPNKHDYMIMESEADQVAREAAKALKRSRSVCNNAASGVPNWTGQSGAKKPRFGQKKNSILLDKTKKTEPSKQSQLKKSQSSPTFSASQEQTTLAPTMTSAQTTQQHFDGSLAGNVVKNLETGTSSNDMFSSDQLLLQMRKRNEVAKPPGGEDDDEEGEDNSVPMIDSDSYKLISNIKNFILFGCNTIGSASTQEILDEFGPRLPPSDSAKFKAMLTKICNYDRNNGIGFWKLRNEFRF